MQTSVRLRTIFNINRASIDSRNAQADIIRASIYLMPADLKKLRFHDS